MKVLIVGGSGHVSGTLAEEALAANHEVWTVTRGLRPVPEGVHSLVADRHDSAAIDTAIAGAATEWDLVVDCICYDVADIKQDIEIFRERAARFVFVSTDFVYDPSLRTFPQSEDTSHYVPDRQGHMEYGRKKRLCELALANADAGSMRWTIVRPCHIYGPKSELGCLPMHGRDPELVNRLKDGEPIRLVGGGHFLQQPILADDLARTILSIRNSNMAAGRVFNTAGPDIIESRRYYGILADALGVELTVEEIPIASFLHEHPERTPFVCHRIYDLSSLKTCGLNVPSTPIDQGLRLHLEGLLERKNITRDTEAK